jgi:ankyrin repeat protein
MEKNQISCIHNASRECNELTDALMKGCVHCFLLFSEQEDFDINQKFHYNFTVIHLATTDILKIIFEEKRWKNQININETNDAGYTALHTSCALGPVHNVKTFERIKLLVENGIDLNIQSNIGESAIFFLFNNICMSRTTVDILEYMLEKKTDPNIQSLNGDHILKNLIKKMFMIGGAYDNEEYILECIHFLIDKERIYEELIYDAWNYMEKNNMVDIDILSIFQNWEKNLTLFIKEPSEEYSKSV